MVPPEAGRLIRLAEPDIDDADLGAVAEVLRSGWLVQGPRVAAFERAMAGRAGVPHAVAVANGTHLGLQAAVFTNDLSKAFWYADRIRSGTVVVNDSTDFWETFQPFGGAAGTDTGWGRQRIDEFTDLQTVVFVLREDG